MSKVEFNLRNVVKTVACLVKRKIMNRGIFLRKVWFCLLSTGIILSFASCSSPESDGIKAAKVAYNYRKDYEKKQRDITKGQNKAYETYIKKFNSYSFKTRVEAREKLSEHLDKPNKSFQKLDEDYREWMNKAYEYRNKLAGKYQTNREKEDKFNYAYNNYRPIESSSKTPQDVYIDYQSEIRNLIKTIIPPKPNVEQLKNDLNGRVIVNQTAGYYNWTINSSEDLKELEVLNTTDNGKEILFDTQLKLQRTNQWDAIINVRYVLSDNEDWWKLETFNSQMNIVRTGKYDNCVSIEGKSRGNIFNMGYTIESTNRCDVELVVGGEWLPRLFSGTATEWREFNFAVNANTTRTMDSFEIDRMGLRYGILESKINFVEQAGL